MRWLTHWRAPLAGSLLCALLGVAGLVLPFGEYLANLSYDFVFAVRPNIPVDGVTVLYLDDHSIRTLEQRYAPGDRWIYAECLKRLDAMRARLAVFDILFDVPGANDEAFVEAARRFGRVVVASQRLPRNLGSGMIVTETCPPFPALRAVVADGLVEESTDPDQFMRHHVRGYDVTPSLAMRAVQLVLSNPPPARTGTRWINYYGPPLHLPNYSLVQVISNQVPVSAISNKVVFVGARVKVGTVAGKGADSFRTPYSRWIQTRAPGAEMLSPGVEVTATTFLNLLRGDWLTRVSPGMELAACISLGLLFGAALAFLTPLAATGVGLAGMLVVFGIGVFLPLHDHLWFSWLVPVALQIPAAIVVSALAHNLRLHFENEVLAATLAATEAAREAMPQLTPTPQAAALGTLSPAGAGRLSSFFNSPGAAAASGPPAVDSLEPRLVPIPDHTLVRPIGRGAYGEVWLARDIIGTYHAVKIVSRASFKEDAPFEREFNGLKRFTPISRSHPGFVHILHVGKNDQLGCMFYIMELGDDEKSGQKIDPERYVPRTLGRMLAGHKRLPVTECVRLGKDLASALHHMHSHDLIHRDIKPSNIIFVNGTPKFADIGLVTTIAAEDRDVTQVGTLPYLPPEGAGKPQADIFSLGKVLYQASMGMDPASFPDLPSDLLKGEGEEALFLLNSIIVKACEPDRRHRFQTAAELEQALARVQTSLRGKQAA